MSEKTYSIKRFVFFSIALFVFVCVVGSAVFIVSMNNIIRSNKEIELLQILEIQRINLENSVNSEIAIVLKLADSPLIKRYFTNPSDAEIKNLAVEEINAYRHAFSSFSIFWVNDIDMIFYSDENTPYKVNPDVPDNYWYNMTLYETETYNFNINYNPDLEITNLWINAPVFDENNKPIGIVGTGIELTAYIDIIYQSIEENVDFYLFNELGEITAAEDIEFVVEKKKIYEELRGISFDTIRETKKLGLGETLIYTVPSGKIVIGSIPVLNWYSVAVSSVGIADYDPAMVVLFLVMLVVLAVVLIVFNGLVAKFVKSLIKTMNSLEAASQAKSKFLATMSHEIRTPMNAILGITQIQTQKDKIPDEYAEAFEKINASGNHLLGIINDILDLSKIETGKLELSPTEYDVPSFINDTVHLNSIRIGSKPLDFILDIDENLPSKLYGDELRLKQILNNLLSNAIKYTDNGYVKLSISHSDREDGDVDLCFAVEDTGHGMKPEDLEKLFSEEYLRFNYEANRETEGTGIGLNITKNLAELMGGGVSVVSEYGNGSVFTVTVRQKTTECLPVGDKIAANLRGFSYVSNKSKERHEIARFPMPYGKVLVVDDVDSNLFVAEGLLLPYELKIETANSGFKVIEKIKGGEVYDVIFMDHMMPKMDGMETTQKLRELGYKGVIIALTANALVGNDEMFRKNGFDGFIAKPIDIRQLNETLNKFVRERYPEEAKKYKAKTVVKADDTAISPKLAQVFCRTAVKAIAALRGAIPAENGDIQLFTTTVHGMKSALANIGETEASEAAFALEKAGLEGDIDFIADNTESFIKTLEELTEKLRPSETQIDGEDDISKNFDFLVEQLKIIKNACENYDDNAVFSSLDLLGEKTWKRETAAAFESIRDVLYLNSDFDEAKKLAEELLHTYTTP